MKNVPTLPRKEQRGVCVSCRASLPIGLLRLVGKPAVLMCTNQAACRKRRRQAASTPTNQ